MTTKPSNTRLDSAKPFKLTMVKPLESDVQTKIIEYLRHEMARGNIAWVCRVNSGARKVGGRWIAMYRYWLPTIPNVEKHYPDIHGMMGAKSKSPGRYFCFEVKRDEKEKATPGQLDFVATTIAGGGIAGVVSSYDEVKALLFGGAGNE